MNLYSEADQRAARMRLRRRALPLGGFVALMALAYVLALRAGAQGAMLAALLAAFVAFVFAGDLWLLPEWRYLRFLREMQRGLRRSADGVLGAPGSEAQLQDGARVFALEAQLDDGDSRVFYIAADKATLLPPPGTRLRIISYGRHIVAWEALVDAGGLRL